MRKFVKFAVAGLAAASLLGAAPAAMAGAPKAPAAAGAVITSGACSSQSTWMLTLKKDAGRVEADLEVQTPLAGQLWTYRMFDNGVRFARGHKTTIADGSFSVTKFATNQAGPDAITAKAKNTVTGEVCKASGTF